MQPRPGIGKPRQTGGRADVTGMNDADTSALSNEELRAVEVLRHPETIRQRCEQLFARAEQGRSEHFTLHLERLPDIIDRVREAMRARYRRMEIPHHSRWSHFRAGNVERLTELDGQLRGAAAHERGRALYDLVITSVLLDAGAGDHWTYEEAQTGLRLGRSEGLAVASLRMFQNGIFSSRPGEALRADAAALEATTPESLAPPLQVSDANPLVALAGRSRLLQQLGRNVRRRSEFQRHGESRPGHLFDYFVEHARGGKLPAPVMLRVVLRALGDIWPGRVNIGGVNLGDVWYHSAVCGEGLGAQLVPFHKMSQWLTYSLVEPLEQAGIRVTAMDELTGLAEYRNGGLFLDSGVIVPRDPLVMARRYAPDHEVVVEWRALTVGLLDRVAARVREAVGADAETLPLTKVLEGGTWQAGRDLARRRRPAGGAPIQIDSDGTVF